MKIRVAQSKRHRSGQIMAEACIGLALLSFTWILISYTSFMTTNRIRTAMAARHMSWWIAKTGADPQSLTSKVNAEFFYNSFAVVEKGSDPINHAGSIGVPILAAPLIPLHGFMSDSGSPNRTRVTFGINLADLNSPSVAYPFSLMNTHVPFMTNSLLDGFLSVNSQCQWAAINDAWTNNPANCMNRLPLSAFKNEGDVYINTLLSRWSSLYNSLNYVYWSITTYVPKCLPCQAYNNTVGLLKKKKDCSSVCTPPANASFGCSP